MKSIREKELKIKAAQREYFRYTGASAELEKRGAGTSRPELAWIRRAKLQAEQRADKSALGSVRSYPGSLRG
jgi:hypothetical protein